MKRTQISGLAAGIAMMAGAMSLAGAPMERVRHEPEPEIEPVLNQRGKRRGPMPKPSKPLPSDYCANVQAQRGFTQARIDYLRRRWLLQNAKDRPSWADWLNSNRKSDLELEFVS